MKTQTTKGFPTGGGGSLATFHTGKTFTKPLSTKITKHTKHFESFLTKNAFLGLTRTYGFTLAEVLITLGIIGVVAAMTLPTLINNIKHKELNTQLKKSYSVLSQAILRMGEDTGLTINYDNFPDKTFILTFKKYFSGFGDCGHSACEVLDKSDPSADDYRLSKRYKTYSKSRYLENSLFDEGQIMLTDSMFIMVQNSDLKEYGIMISVDVNGLNKLPNAWGHDIFTFAVTDKGKLLPMGAPGTKFTSMNEYCSASSSHQWNGAACTYRALTEKDYFKNLPK